MVSIIWNRSQMPRMITELKPFSKLVRHIREKTVSIQRQSFGTEAQTSIRPLRFYNVVNNGYGMPMVSFLATKERLENKFDGKRVNPPFCFQT
ncbi:hypothetical protein AVEN_209517-1 [Araneus ventricosus]|uniref:Uncharacterized protein n=1 Tax=Araneus ventricosus TaxID=182803 RepID=A0A4Y2INA3_ARAVE|nr:hypothetical protein AVEN_209517-1 [Araneus ventricosus]